MPDARRPPVVSAALPPRRAREATTEQESLARFCAEYGLRVDAAAVMMYLTSVQDSAEQVSGRGIRSRIARLDLAARLTGQQPWSRDPDLRRYVNGLHHDLPLSGGPRADPLYQENAAALIQATLTWTHDQTRDVAALLAAHDTGLPARALATLRWDAVHLTRRTAIIEQPGFAVRAGLRGPSLRMACRSPHEECLVHALHSLRRLTGTRTGLVFASAWGETDRGRLGAVIRPLREHDCPEVSLAGDCLVLRGCVADLRRPTPGQARDRALIALSFSAALRGREAIALTVEQLNLEPSGLLLHVPGRREPTWIATEDDLLDTAGAWSQWLASRAAQEAPTDLAFPQLSGSRIWDRPMAPPGLNYLVQQRADQARLRGTYTFTSLRIGCIRTMLRSGIPAHTVAGRADLRSLTSVARHDARENLLRDNVAARLGL